MENPCTVTENLIKEVNKPHYFTKIAIRLNDVVFPYEKFRLQKNNYIDFVENFFMDRGIRIILEKYERITLSIKENPMYRFFYITTPEEETVLDISLKIDDIKITIVRRISLQEIDSDKITKDVIKLIKTYLK